jgi:uroporphyrin-III C-methyltransferase
MLTFDTCALSRGRLGMKPNAMNPPTQPKVWLVGAGPGDPDLLTLRAHRVLQQADVVLVDDLVDARILAQLPPSTRVLPVGKRGGCVSTDQAFIHTLMIREAKRGLNVVRLKGGDPFVFGRGGEECDALRAAGIAVHVVSGLTSGMAAPAAIGVPVTDRRHAPGVAFVTGHSGDGATAPDWPALVQSRLTLVIYMGVSHSAKLQRALLDAGMPPTMPCAVITQACTPQQRHACMPLQHLASTIQQQRLASPAIIVVGEVVLAAQAIGCAWPAQASAQTG